MAVRISAPKVGIILPRDSPLFPCGFLKSEVNVERQGSIHNQNHLLGILGYDEFGHTVHRTGQPQLHLNTETFPQ